MAVFFFFDKHASVGYTYTVYLFHFPMDEKIMKPNIRFTKDDEGKRIAQEISHEEIAAMPKKDIGIIVVGHVDHAKEQLLAALEKSDFTGNILLVGAPEDARLPGHE